MTRVPHIQLGRSGPRFFATLCEFTALDLIGWGNSEEEALQALDVKVLRAQDEALAANILIQQTMQALTNG